MNRRTWRRVAAGVLCATAIAPMLGWDAHGHRVITYAALERMQGGPAWLRDPQVMHMIADQSTMPDRWRGTRMLALTHENGPDHYLDVELLDEFGLTLETLPRLRREYLRVMVLAKDEHPERVSEYNPDSDPPRQYEWPGFVPHAIMEHYGKLRASFSTLRILEALNDPDRSFQVEMARANVMYHMGVLSHYVGDTAQPLHTTKHHHGWVGENPSGYTTDRGIHAYIDGGVLRLHKIGLEEVRPYAGVAREVDREDPWEAVIAHVERSFVKVEPLYQMAKSGQLEEEEGARFIQERLGDGAAMLAALYVAAWESAEPTDADISSFLRFDGDDPGELLRLEFRAVEPTR